MKFFILKNRAKCNECAVPVTANFATCTKFRTFYGLNRRFPVVYFATVEAGYGMLLSQSVHSGCSQAPDN